MTPLDRINAYTAHRMGIMTKEERDATIAAQIADDLCKPVLHDCTDPDAASWRGLKLAQRTRLAAAMRHLLSTGTLNRSDIQRIGEISVPQASIDINVIQSRTNALAYDRRAKTYRLAEGDEGSSQ